MEERKACLGTEMSLWEERVPLVYHVVSVRIVSPIRKGKMSSTKTFHVNCVKTGYLTLLFRRSPKDPFLKERLYSVFFSLSGREEGYL